MSTTPLPTARWRFLTALTSSRATILFPAGTQFFGETSVSVVGPDLGRRLLGRPL